MDCPEDAGLRALNRLADGPPVPGVVLCEQATYTAVRSQSGQGYRVTAQSGGIPASEISEIVRCTPAVGGLCADSPDAVGVSFFPLRSGRYAVLHTCHAGKEPTGRGGRRAYTRVVVVDAAGLRPFRNNPFALLRAVGAAGGLEVDLTPAQILPQITLAPGSHPPSNRFSAAMKQLGKRCGGCLADRLLAGDSMVASVEADSLALAEMALLVLPAPMRPSISCSAGVNFSISRRHRFVAIEGDPRRARQRIHGTPYAFVNLTTEADPMPRLDHPWSRAVQRLFEAQPADPLPTAVADRFADEDMAALNRIADLCIALEKARSVDLPDLIDLATPYLSLHAPSPLERDLARQMIRLTTDRLTSLIPHADAQSLAGLWQRLLLLTPQLPPGMWCVNSAGDRIRLREPPRIGESTAT